MAKLTYFPLIMDRWIAGTRYMDLEQVGAYIQLLVYLYENPNHYLKDEEHISRILGVRLPRAKRLWNDSIRGKPPLKSKFTPISNKRATGTVSEQYSNNTGIILGYYHGIVRELLRNGGKIRGLQGGSFPTDPEPDPDPEEKKKKPSVSKKKSSDVQTGKRLAEGWGPSSELIAWTRQTYPQIDVSLEADRFRDYWLSMPGQRGRKVDWDRTWRNWIRKEADTAARRRGQPQAKPQKPRLPEDYYNPDGSINERYSKTKPNGRRYTGTQQGSEQMEDETQTMAADDAERFERCGTVVDEDARACLAAIRGAAVSPDIWEK